jgi:hypothetical protein
MQLYMTATEGAESAACTMDMLNSQGDVTDSAQVQFTVNATVTDPIAVSDGTREALSRGDSGHRTCQDKCGNGMFNLLCFYWNSCKGQMAKAIGIVLSAFILGVCKPAKVA